MGQREREREKKKKKKKKKKMNRIYSCLGAQTFKMWAYLYPLIALCTIIFVVVALWYIMWKLAFEPNPMVREFFTLDGEQKKKNKDGGGKAKNGATSSKKR